MTEAAFARQQPETEQPIGPDVGQRIRKARVERGMTLAQLGGEDLSRSFLSLVETGKARISLRSLSIVARRLELPLSYFVSDTSREEAAELLVNDAQEAMERHQPEECLRILDRAELTDDTRVRALSLRGWALTRLSQTTEAIQVLREAVPLAEQGGDPQQIAETRGRLAIALYQVQSHHEAIEQLGPALQAASKVGDPVVTGKLTSLLGHIYYVQHDLDAAIAQYSLARRCFDSIGDLGGLASVYSGLSQAHRHQGDVRAALRYSRLAVGICEAQSWQRNAASELNNLALRYLEAGELEAAVESAKKAIDRARQAEARDLEAVAHSTLASLLLRLDERVEARTEAETAIGMADDANPLGRIDAQIVLARLAEEEGDREQADDLFARALTALENSGFKSKYADAALTYSRVLRARGDLEGTIRYLDIAAAMSVKGLADAM